MFFLLFSFSQVNAGTLRDFEKDISDNKKTQKNCFGCRSSDSSDHFFDTLFGDIAEDIFDSFLSGAAKTIVEGGRTSDKKNQQHSKSRYKNKKIW